MAESAREIHWSTNLADFQLSGLTHVEFCTPHRISNHAYRACRSSGDTIPVRREP